MKIGTSKSPVLIGLIAASAGFAAIAAVVRQGPVAAPGELKSVPQMQGLEPVPSSGTKTPIRATQEKTSEKSTPAVREERVVRYVVMDGEAPKLGKELTLKSGEDARERSLAATLKSLGYGDVRVLKVDVEKGAAMVDVNPALTSEGFSSTSEAALIEALQRTLGQFEDVKTFQLRIDGQIVDSLGHLELGEPIKVLREGEKSDPSDSPSREPSP
ncbi:hypothetical protein EON77_04460 [bacterium]|nr:MAG: hypothetical protein EON77_04460 [bacterium]